MRHIIAALIVIGTAASAVAAEDCGEQPVDKPSLPDGSKANPDQMRVARDAVVAFSSAVDEWLQCMDNRSTRLAPYLTREQRARLSEDLNKLHEERQALQRALNTEIRAYRNARADG